MGECSPLKDSPPPILQEGHILIMAKEAFVLHFPLHTALWCPHLTLSTLLLCSSDELLMSFHLDLFNLTGNLLSLLE